MTTSASDTRAFCNCCARENDHRVLWQHQQSRYEGTGQYLRELVERCEVLQCGGCRSLRFRLTTDYPDFKRSLVEEHPAALRRRLPHWHEDLPANVRDAHREIHTALQVGIPRLAMMGARAVIESALNEVLANRTDRFSDMLKAAVEEKVLTESQKETLEAAIEAGHAAVHREFIPHEKQVADVFDIVDYLLQTVFILEGSATRLRCGIPPRPPKERK